MAKKTKRKRTPRTAAKKTGKTTRSPSKGPRRKSAGTVARKKTAARAAAVRRRRNRTPPPKPSRLSTAATTLRGAVAGAVAIVSRRIGTAGEKPDGVELLEREHRRFEELLKQGEETTERARATRRELLKTLTRELNAHELMGEKVLYPALQAHPQAREVVLAGFEEHHVADLIVKELHEIATNEEAWGPKFKVLKENIEHHIKEEEGNMFRLARGIFTRDELHRLAAQMMKVRRTTSSRRRA